MPPGSFLIRKSQAKVGFTLSVRGEDEVIRHYHIKTLWSEVDTSFFITSGLRFPSLAKLVHHYRNKAGGLCCILTYPCRTAEQLAPSGHPQNVNKDAQKSSSDANLSSSQRTSQKEAAGQYPRNTKKVRAEDAQKTSSDTRLSSCLRTGQNQAAGQYPQETSCFAKPSSCLRASQKQAEGNRKNLVSLTIFPVVF